MTSPRPAPAIDGSRLASLARRLLETGALPGLREADLLAASLGEEIRRLEPFVYEGVEITLLDESSGMASGTFKSVDAWLSAALARKLGAPLVCGSGGNTGAAVALYAAAAGVPAALVVPEQSLRALRLPPACADTPVVALERSAELKIFTSRLAGLLDAAEAPRLDWRYAAGTARGLAIADWAALGPAPDWLSQTVSAAFGPIGVLRAFDGRGARAPRLLAVQQSENCPFYRRWKDEQGAPAPGAPFLPHIYDPDPFAYGSYGEFERLMRRGGEMAVVSAAEFEAWRARARGTDCARVLAGAGMPLYGPAADAAGLVGLAGVFAATDRGLVRSGERVWHSLTSGAPRPAHAPPRRLIRAPDASEAALETAARRVRAAWRA